MLSPKPSIAEYPEVLHILKEIFWGSGDHYIQQNFIFIGYRNAAPPLIPSLQQDWLLVLVMSIPDLQLFEIGKILDCHVRSHPQLPSLLFCHYPKTFAFHPS